MMDYEGKRSGQIPAFGNWDYAHDLPITQYFECARQAGLIPPPLPPAAAAYSSSSLCQCGPCVNARHGYATDVDADAAAVAADFRKPPLRVFPHPPKKRGKAGDYPRRPPQVKEEKKQARKANDVVKEQQPRSQLLSMKQQMTEQPLDHGMKQRSAAAAPRVINVKPVDEDLYKIPSPLLHNSKRKKMLGFFSRCLVPDCRA